MKRWGGHDKGKALHGIGQRQVNTYSLRVRKGDEYFPVHISCSWSPILGTTRLRPIRQARHILEGFDYFQVPTFVITEVLPKLKQNDKKIYLAMYQLVRFEEDRIIRPEGRQRPSARIRKQAGTRQFSLLPFFAAGLIRLIGEAESSGVELLDPESGMSFAQSGKDAPQNWIYQGRRFRILEEFQRDPERMLQRIGIVTTRRNAANTELNFRCPFHDDRRASAQINLVTGQWYCSVCEESGNLARGGLTKIIARVKGLSSQVEVAKEVARIMGKELEYAGGIHERLLNAGHEYYDYYDQDGTPIYRKFRIQKGTEKHFTILRWSEETQSYYLPKRSKKLSPLLYRYPQPETRTVYLCEGEKDVRRVEELLRQLEVQMPRTMVTTSGGANSWDDKLADHLIDKQVYLLPDGDDAGRLWVMDVIASLVKRCVKYQVIENEAGDISNYIKSTQAD
jgi:5S rRNA maturation endonuclease (ribonuclease M5)